MLMARNADMCSKCLVTEPVVRSFIGADLRLERRVSQPQKFIPPLRRGRWLRLKPSQAVAELAEELRQRTAFATFRDAG